MHVLLCLALASADPCDVSAAWDAGVDALACADRATAPDPLDALWTYPADDQVEWRRGWYDRRGDALDVLQSYYPDAIYLPWFDAARADLALRRAPWDDLAYARSWACSASQPGYVPSASLRTARAWAHALRRDLAPFGGGAGLPGPADPRFLRPIP
jgi:hypothetical protein